MSNLEIRRVNLPDATAAQGVVIVIDVIRAFSVAAYAFSRGAVGAVNATHVLICSLVNAKATALCARKLADTTGGLITLHPTFYKSNVVSEDSICADYLEALLNGQADASILLDREITNLEHSGRFDFLKFGDPDFPFDDIAAILDIDRFDFVMLGTHKHWRGITYVEVEKGNV